MAKQAPTDLGHPQKPISSAATSSKPSNHDSPPTAKKISFSIVVISVPLLYVSLLHSSSSSLFNDSKFWFLMSNAIILIVAADSGAFAGASDEPAADIYQEYVEHSKSRSTGGLVPREPPRVQLVGKETNACVARLVPLPSQGATSQREEQLGKEECAMEGSERAAPSTDHADESKGVLCRTALEKKGGLSEGESEYAAMSDDELNRRVEEFIRRFNREIRRQEWATHQPRLLVV